MIPHSAAPRPAHLLTRALRSVTTLLLLSAWGTTCTTFAATIPAPYELATWRGFRASAVSYTFDDNSPKQFSVAQPMFDAKGLHATFFCIVGSLSDTQWTTINSASSKGHEIGSHTLSHPNLTTLSDEDVAIEEYGARDLIESHTGKKCVSLAYPYCAVPNKTITSQYYAFARSCNGALVPSTPADFLSIGSMGPEGDMNAKADDAATSGSWLVWLLHGIDDDPACCPIASPVLQANLNHVTSDSNKWWVETFGNVSRYIQERNAAVLTVVSNDAASITLRLTHTLDNTIFDYPLTLRRSMPGGWVAAAVTQNGVSVPSQIVDGKLVFDVVPNGGDIVLAKTDPPQGQSNIGADDPNIQYVGRFDMTNPAAPGFDWSLSTIRAKFQGTSCSVKLDGFGKYFDVFIDGVITSPIISTSGGLQTFVVASGLSDSVHSISFCRRAEATAGKSIFRGFVLDGGKTLVAPGPAPTRKIEFIGDSYTCGYGVETMFGEPFSNATENARLSYAGLMASHYNADCMITARSGHGMVRNYNSPNQTSPDPVPFYYPRTCGSVASNDYAFTWQPDVVVVVLGINDFSTTPYPSEEQYVGGYSSFIATLRGHYPNAHILCTWWSGMPAFASNYIAAAVSASGDNKVHFANVPFNIDFPADYGADYHPNVTGQTKIADAFIPVFDSIMGSTWGGDTTPVPDPPVMKGWYAFEGNSLDTSGNGNDGTPNALSYVSGKLGAQAAQFDGTSSFVTIPRSVTDDFTVAMWVKTTDTAGAANAQWWAGKGLVDGEVAGGGADWGTALVDGKFVLGVGSTGGDTTLASSVNINDGAWHHVVATRSNTTGAMAVYVDGVSRGSGTGPTGSRTLPASLRIGGLQTGNNFLNGTLDDVRLYDRILSAGEIGVLAERPPEVTRMIYQDSLDSAWQNWSWATVNMASAAQVRRGSSAIAVTAGEWAALYLRRSALQDTTGYSAVAFWVHGGASGGQPLMVIGLRDGQTQPAKSIPAPTAGVWTRVVIPLSELGLANVSDFNGLMIQNASGSPVGTFHVDDVALVGVADADDWTSQDWQSWRQSRFSASELADDGVSGPGADPDHDGVPNRIEWWLLRDPFGNDGFPWCSWQLADGVVALTYDRRAGFPSDITLQTSVDLDVWQPAVGTTQVQALDASGLSELVSWSIPTTEPKLFLRLK